VTGPDDYNAAAIRASLRVFLASFIGLKAWDLFRDKVLTRGKAVQYAFQYAIRYRSTDDLCRTKINQSLWQSPNVRLSSSLSLILLFHRFLYRFLKRLRSSLLTENGEPFRRRNTRISKLLTSRLAPAVGASFAGFFLSIYPSSPLRTTIAIYVFSRALEFTYNHLEDLGYFKNRPWWFGSWLLMPAATGQLLHAFVFDRDCFPESYGSFILKYSGTYVHRRPKDCSPKLAWPRTYEIVDSLAEISRLRWPPFVSPILFPAKKNPLPQSLTAISPITSPAHPRTTNLSCALLHPHDPSCLRTYLTFYLRAFPSIARFFTIIFGALSLLRYRSFIKEPIPALNRLAKSILRMSLFITGAIGTAWGSICFFQQVLPRKFLPTQRWFLGGFLGGLWAFLERKSGRSDFLYSARLSLDSLWKVGVKHGWWKSVRGGDVYLFVGSLMVIQALYEVNTKSVSGAAVRKGLSWVNGEGWIDRAAVRDEEGEEKGKREEIKKLEEREMKQAGVPLDDVGAESTLKELNKGA